MKKILIKLLGIGLFFCVPTFAQPTAAFFYGKNVPVLQLCMYDIIVVDPESNFNPAEDCSFNQAFAYVSLGEVVEGASYEKSIDPTWVIGKNEAWNNNKVIDQTQKNWQKFFLNQIIDPLWKKGYRGFFFDTLDSYTLAVTNSELQQKQIEGMVSIIKEMKIRYPDVKIILNRGFQLLPEVHDDIYAVVIESLYHAWNQKKQIYETTSLSEHNQLLEEIKKIQLMGLPIIIIDYLSPAQQNKAQALANQIAQQGLIPWITDSTLQAMYSNKVQAIPRHIMLMFDNKTNLPIRFVQPLHYIGSILEYMGYIPKYINLEEMKQFPAGDLSQQYAGIILWLDNQSDTNIPLLHWAQKQIAHKIPVVFLNSFGVAIGNEELAKLGLLSSPVKRSIESLQIAKMDPHIIGYEIKPSITPYDFMPFQAVSSQVLLQMRNGNQQTEDVVAITPWGGYALFPYFIQELPDFSAFWIIEPFEFFHRALRLQNFPVPDTTTENGRRLMSVHIDGDGFSYQAKWAGGGFAAEELRDRILKQFRIPTSVSVITGEIAPNGIHPAISPKLMDIARSIFALPWVEIASHTFSHPFYWQQNRNKQLDLQGESFGINIPGYKFNLAVEITGSVDFINKNLTPPNKKCHLFFWSGLADPTNEAIALTYQDNLLNINGVGTHSTNLHPSITHVHPMGIALDGHYQIFAPIDLDLFYTNNLSEPLYGFEDVIQTLKLTDSPRRFKPIDLYYHFYSASFPATLQALIKVYRWALAQPVMNIYISDYIKKVMDFYQITIVKQNDSWIIYTKGDLRELRSEQRFGYPDLITSENVIGFNEHGNDFYIHLGPNHFSHINYQKTKPVQPYLVEANARVVSYLRNKNQFVVMLEGYMPLQVTFANVKQCQMSSKTPLKKIINSDETISYSSTASRDEIHFNC